jgi:hypothetical protein
MNFRSVGQVPLGGWGRPYHELIKDPTWKWFSQPFRVIAASKKVALSRLG